MNEVILAIKKLFNLFEIFLNKLFVLFNLFINLLNKTDDQYDSS
jgi:hypothetical protein